MQDVFLGCDSVEAVKTLYKKLAFQYHPDLNEAAQRDYFTQQMQSLNAALEKELARRDQEQSAPDSETGEARTYRYNVDREKDVVEKLDETIRVFAVDVTAILGYNPMLKVTGAYPDGDPRCEVELYLVGAWLWLRGEGEATKPFRNLLNRQGLGYQWSNEKVMWYWRREADRTGFHSKGDFASIAGKYGAERIVSDDDRARKGRRKTFKGGSKALKSRR